MSCQSSAVRHRSVIGNVVTVRDRKSCRRSSMNVHVIVKTIEGYESHRRISVMSDHVDTPDQTSISRSDHDHQGRGQMCRQSETAALSPCSGDDSHHRSSIR